MGKGQRVAFSRPLYLKKEMEKIRKEDLLENWLEKPETYLPILDKDNAYAPHPHLFL